MVFAGADEVSRGLPLPGKENDDGREEKLSLGGQWIDSEFPKRRSADQSMRASDWMMQRTLPRQALSAIIASKSRFFSGKEFNQFAVFVMMMKQMSRLNKRCSRWLAREILADIVVEMINFATRFGK